MKINITKTRQFTLPVQLIDVVFSLPSIDEYFHELLLKLVLIDEQQVMMDQDNYQ
jgi:hypothetical protein